MVEAAFALSFLLLFLFASLDLLWAGFRVVTLQYVAERGMRTAIIDGVDSATIQSSIITLARDLNVNLDPAHTGSSPYVSLCPVLPSAVSAPPCPGDVNLGEPGDLLILRIEIPLKNLLITGSNLLSFLGMNVVVENRARHEFPM